MSEFALDGLKQVMAIKSRVVLPYLVPKVSPHTWQPSLAQQPQPRHHPQVYVMTSSEPGCWGRPATLQWDRISQSPALQLAWAGPTKLMFIVLQLTTPPVNTRVLAFLSSVAGDALTRHLGVILPAVMLALKEKLGTPDEQLVRGTVTPADSIHVLSHPGGVCSAEVSPVLLGDGQLSGRDPVRGGRHRAPDHHRGPVGSHPQP